jgi:hypothetical protein
VAASNLGWSFFDNQPKYAITVTDVCQYAHIFVSVGDFNIGREVTQFGVFTQFDVFT